MAQSRRTTQKYVYDIPYLERMELCRVLDQNDKWEELGGVHMNFDMLTIQTLRREILRGNSPTDELLTKWGHQNHTILELFVLLSKMQHYQAMLIIKQFVNPEYHRLIYEGEQNLHRIFKEKPISKLNISNVIDQKIPQTPKGRENIGTEHNQSISNNLHDISENLDFSKPQNNIKDKDAFLGYNLNGNEEKKILNHSVPTAANSSSSSSSKSNNNNNNNDNNNNRNNAQTVLMNKMGNNIGNEKKNLVFKSPKHESAKDLSEMSSIAETVGILPVIACKELEIATNGWDHNTILGKGGFGTVYKGIWKNTSVAIKRTRTSETNENHSVQIQQILGELKLLNSYRHDNILPLYGFSIDGEDPCLIYQFMPNGSLEDRLLCRQGTKALSWHQRHNIAIGTARGIQFLHTIGEKPLIHGDIKSANILLDSNFEPKIGDFGLAREGPYNHYTHMKVSRVHGTRPYLPDEFLRHKKFSTKVDTHSFGIVLFELATGLRAYDDQRHHKFLKDLMENTHPGQLNTLIDRKCGPDEQTFLNLIELGKCCVARKPKDRPEMVLVLQELNVMAVKRDMMVKVQSMIRQNSLTPSTPFEMQVLYDNLSQQKRISPNCSTANHFRAPTRAISPLQPYNDPVLNNAGAIEAQMVFNGQTNNPFLNVDFLKENENKIKDIKLQNDVINNEKDGTENFKEIFKNEVLPGPSPKEKVEVREMNRNPVISVCPPSTSQTSSVSSEEETIPSPQQGSQQEDLDYEYTSDVENFLPLISVLGVKRKSEQPNENATPMEQSDSSGTTVGPLEINTSAKGKPLWILNDIN